MRLRNIVAVGGDGPATNRDARTNAKTRGINQKHTLLEYNTCDRTSSLSAAAKKPGENLKTFSLSARNRELHRCSACRIVSLNDWLTSEAPTVVINLYIHVRRVRREHAVRGMQNVSREQNKHRRRIQIQKQPELITPSPPSSMDREIIH